MFGRLQQLLRQCRAQFQGGAEAPVSAKATAIGLGPCTIGSGPCTIGSGPCTIGSGPCTIGSGPCTIGSGPCTIGSGPCTIGSGPCTIGSGPCTIGSGPCTIRQTPCKIISIEGNIGSGKSTLLQQIQDKFGADYNGKKIGYLPEPVAVWNTITDAAGVTILEHYYADQAKYAFAFQMMAYISRLAALRQALTQGYDVVLTERSVFTDRHVFAKMLHDDGKILDIEFNIYMRWFDEFVADLPAIQLVYIRTSPAVALQRVSKRARKGEAIIPLAYLEQCHAYHERWLKTDVDKLVLAGDEEQGPGQEQAKEQEQGPGQGQEQGQEQGQGQEQEQAKEQGEPHNTSWLNAIQKMMDY